MLQADTLRIPDNKDWVIAIIVCCIGALIFMLNQLNREANLKEFFSQKFEETSNIFLNWVVTSVCFALLLSAFLSQYVPILPKWFLEHALFGFQLNKFGYTFLCVSAVYLVKVVFGFLYFSGVDSAKKWFRFYNYTTKIYFAGCFLLIIMNVLHYYFPIDRLLTLQYSLLIITICFIFKIILYVLHRNPILPNQWYYKFLYICTLQIVPVIVLWKVLFF